MDKAYADTVRLLLAVTPAVFNNDIFAMKGGTAINLFVQDMPRLSVDIDVVYRPWQTQRDEALQAINVRKRVRAAWFGLNPIGPCWNAVMPENFPPCAGSSPIWKHSENAARLIFQHRQMHR